MHYNRVYNIILYIINCKQKTKFERLRYHHEAAYDILLYRVKL